MDISKRFVYLLQSSLDPKQHYVGLTADPFAHLRAHNAGDSPYTARFRPWRMLATIESSNVQRANGHPPGHIADSAVEVPPTAALRVDTGPKQSIDSCRMSTRKRPQERVALLQGTLDLLILRTLVFGAQHGQGIARAIEQQSEDTLLVDHGSLYPALQRLEKRGWIAAEWGTSDNNRKARFYELTRKGRKQLVAETDNWRKLTAAIGRILGPQET